MKHRAFLSSLDLPQNTCRLGTEICRSTFLEKAQLVLALTV
jgi:hypothetical protein